MSRVLHTFSLKSAFFTLLLGMVVSSFAYAQNKNNVSELTEGKEYYFAIPHCAKEAGEGVRGAASVELWVSSKKTTKVFGRCEVLGTSFQANISPNKVNEIALSDDYMNTKNEIIQNLGVHLTSTEPVSVTVFVSYLESTYQDELWDVTLLTYLEKTVYREKRFQLFLLIRGGSFYLGKCIFFD